MCLHRRYETAKIRHGNQVVTIKCIWIPSRKTILLRGAFETLRFIVAVLFSVAVFYLTDTLINVKFRDCGKKEHSDVSIYKVYIQPHIRNA